MEAELRQSKCRRNLSFKGRHVDQLNPQSRWLAVLGKLRVNRSQGLAPHKPLLLLVVLEMIENGDLQSSMLRLTPELAFRFSQFGTLVAHRRTQRMDIRLPFFHLSSDGVWTAFTKDGTASLDRRATQYVKIDEEFYALCQSAEFRSMSHAPRTSGNQLLTSANSETFLGHRFVSVYRSGSPVQFDTGRIRYVLLNCMLATIGPMSGHSIPRTLRLTSGFAQRDNAMRLMLGCQLRLLGNEGFSSRHDTSRTVSSCSDPALVIANKNDACELALRMLLVGSYQRKRTICSTTTVLCQPLGNAQDRIVRIDLGIVSLCIERNHNVVRVASWDRCGEQCGHVDASQLRKICFWSSIHSPVVRYERLEM
jgi:hypothetical protein